MRSNVYDLRPPPTKTVTRKPVSREVLEQKNAALRDHVLHYYKKLREQEACNRAQSAELESHRQLIAELSEANHLLELALHRLRSERGQRTLTLWERLRVLVTGRSPE